jgi:hypothetical protein
MPLSLKKARLDASSGHPVLAIAPEVSEAVVITHGLKAPEPVKVTDDAVAALALVAELALAIELPDALQFLPLQAAVKPVGLALKAIFHAVFAAIIAAIVTTILARFLALIVPLGDALRQGAAGSDAHQSAC